MSDVFLNWQHEDLVRISPSLSESSFTPFRLSDRIDTAHGYLSDMLMVVTTTETVRSEGVLLLLNHNTMRYKMCKY